MAFSGVKTSTNKVVEAGHPLVQELKVETAANMVPGALVKRGTNGDDALVATASEGIANGSNSNLALGFLGYSQAHADYKPTNVTTAYAASDRVPVLTGSCRLVAIINSDQTLKKGAPLTAGAAGTLTAATIGTHHVYARLEEDVTAAASHNRAVVSILL